MTDRKTWPLALSVGPSLMNDSSLEALSLAGIHQIELSSGQIDPFFSMLDFPHKAVPICQMAERHDVSITSVHLPFAPFSEIDPASLDQSVRDHAVKIQTELLQAIGKAGIPLAIIHPSGEPYQEEERLERLKLAIDTIRRVYEAACRNGVTLCLENLPRTCLCRTSDEMQAFLDAIPGLQVVFDTNHSLQEDNVHYIHAVGSRIRSLHVSDYDFIDERHLLPGEGKNDWPRILAALEEAGYQGRFLYELKEGYSFEAVRNNYLGLMS